MTRREFLEQMLINTFGVKGIEYKDTINGVVRYTVGGTVYSDCTYSHVYKIKYNKFWKALFDSYNKEISIKHETITEKVDIAIYQNNAKEYILQIISSNTEINSLSKENLTLKVTEHIYINIILNELFKIELLSIDRGEDDFSDSLEKIKNEIIKFASNYCEYSNDFFNDIIEKYPVFSKLQLNKKNKLVFDDIEMIKKFIENSKRIPLSTFDLELVDVLSIREETSIRNGKLATYIDKSIMNAVDFELLTSVITDLYHYSEYYPQVFSEREVETLTSTAIRTYNHFYGKNHVVYSGKANSKHWDMHQHLVEYLFMLQLVMKSKQSTDYDDKKVKEWYK